MDKGLISKEAVVLCRRGVKTNVWFINSTKGKSATVKRFKT